MDNPEVVLYNIEDLQKIFGIGRSAAYQLANSSGFPTIRLNRKLLVPRAELEKWIKQNLGNRYQY